MVWLAVSQAQVKVRTTTLTPDGTLGTTVTQSGNRYTITGGTRPGNGPNLFHSFDRFNVGTGDTASFTGPTGIANIISRVTGGQQSDIDGTLHSEIPGAHFFLLNPSGVLFGANARLDVSGSFHVSTADVLRFADGATFSAHLGEKSTLTVAAPAAFGFLGPTPGPITMQGSVLKVTAGQTLSVVGGDITLVGNDSTSSAHPSPTLKAPGGRIQLVSVASSGEIGLDRVATAPDLRMDGFTRLGRIDLSQGAVATVGGKGSRNAGEIEVRGGQLTLSGGSRLDASTQGAGRGGTVTVQATEALTLTGLNSRLTSSTTGDGDAGQIVVKAPQVCVQEGADIQALTAKNTRGNAGTIRLEVGTLTLTGEHSKTAPYISTETAGTGQGGSITVWAKKAVTLTGPSSRIVSNSNGTSTGDAGRIAVKTPVLCAMGDYAGIRAFAYNGLGKGGDVLVKVGTLMLSDGAIIGSSTQGMGRGGSVTVEATEAIIRDTIINADGTVHQYCGLESSTSGDGQGGDILVKVGTLTLSGGAYINSSSATGGTGSGGRITVRATGAITLTGSIPGSPSRITSSTRGDADAGQIVVEAPRVSVQDGATIRVRSGQVNSDGTLVAGTGRAGNVTITAQILTLTGGSLTTETRGAGPAGDITLNIGSLIAQGATLTSSSIDMATGTTGTVRIQGLGGMGTFANRVTLTGGSKVATDGTVANGGDIQVRVQGTLRLRDSKITTDVGGGQGQGGHIRIDPGVVILERSQIQANAFGGPGGKIELVAQGFLADTTSQVTAFSERNVNGIVDIQAITTPVGLVAPLPPTFAPAAALLRSPCAARLHEGTVSTLVERGRDGMPATPDGVLPSRLPLAPLDTASPPHEEGLPSAARAWPLGEGQRDPSAPLALRGWAASVDALRLVPGDCASR
jgi:filamentous hemagglutinin family protein